MKKILVLINDFNVPDAAVRFAIDLAGKNKATLFGTFVQKPGYSNDSYVFPSDINLTDKDYTKTTDEEEHERLLKAIIKVFEDSCNQAGVPYHVQVIEEKFLDTLVDYSAFADLVVCDGDRQPSQYSINAFLADTHCPVLMVNNDYKKADTLVFTYDDRLSSLYAIRTFTYLFPFFTSLPAHFVSVLPPNVEGLEYEDLIKEWLPLHYPQGKIEVIKGETKDELTRFINKLANPVIIMGAFGRSSLSRFFKESLANYILTQTNAPVFIAHN